MSKLELKPADVRLILSLLFDSNLDGAAELHDEIVGEFPTASRFEATVGLELSDPASV